MPSKSAIDLLARLTTLSEKEKKLLDDVRQASNDSESVEAMYAAECYFSSSSWLKPRVNTGRAK